MLTPVEIQNKEFTRGWRGYHQGEVKVFLEQIVEGYQELYRENQELREQISRLEHELKRYKDLEQTLKDTLVLAQKASEETRQNAAKEGELIVKEAGRQAEELLTGARAEVNRLSGEYENLQQRMLAFRRHWQAVLQAELEVLASMEGAESVSLAGASAAAGKQE